MKNIAVVSLIDAHDRREHINALFKEYNLDFGYFDAINKSQVTNILKKHDLTVETEKMSAGEIGCTLSHYCLWNQIIEKDIPYMMIFEDDIFFAKSAEVLLSDLDWLPCDFDVIKIETTYEKVMLKKEFDLTLSHSLLQMKSRHLGSGGYIISQKAANKLISKVKKLGLQVPVDHMVFEDLVDEVNSKVYQISPAICIQDIIYNKDSIRFESELEKERKPKPKNKQKISVGKKLNREVVRLWKQLKINEAYNTSILIAKGYKSQIVDYKE